MPPDSRRRVRLALSDAFVDQPLDAAGIARRIAGHDRALLERIFFAEVAPLCGSNLETPVPPVWTGFDELWLEDNIERRLQARQQNRWRRWADGLRVRWLRWRYAGVWREIALHLD